MRTWLRVLALMFLLCGAVVPAVAQFAAVAQCSRTQIAGAGTGSTEQQAEGNAVQNCVDRGGIPGCCHPWAVSRPGVPCVAFAQGNGRVNVGGGGSEADAANNAANNCGLGCIAVAAVCAGE
jgi:hypothetical protein